MSNPQTDCYHNIPKIYKTRKGIPPPVYVHKVYYSTPHADTLRETEKALIDALFSRGLNGIFYHGAAMENYGFVVEVIESENLAELVRSAIKETRQTMTFTVYRQTMDMELVR